jgi:hypothetical protein
MLYGAPILFGSSRDLANVANDPICIRTVTAIKSLKPVQIRQLASIKHRVIGAMHPSNAKPHVW